MRRVLATVIFLGLGTAGPAWPSEVSGLKQIDLGHDAKSLQRGARVAMEICHSCHDLKYVRYRDLLDLGFSRAEVDDLSGGLDLQASLTSVTAKDQSTALFGKVPPDLSLMAIARPGGGSYIYSVLTGFYETGTGAIDNHVFPGISMPDVLGYAAARDSGARAESERQARDVAAFLAWAADPYADSRHRIGYGVMIYLAILTLLFYLVKRRTWSRLKHLEGPGSMPI